MCVTDISSFDGKKCKILLTQNQDYIFAPYFLTYIVCILFGNLLNDSKERKNPGWIVCAVRITLLAVLYLNPTNDFSHLS